LILLNWPRWHSLSAWSLFVLPTGDKQMAKKITLKYEAECKDCGALLAAGTLARYYGRGRIYGIGCHEDTRKTNGNGRPVALSDEQHENWSAGRIASHYDPQGAYSVDGEYLGKSGPRCEDAPCCGCCP
jgi:hypothetical protein